MKTRKAEEARMVRAATRFAIRRGWCEESAKDGVVDDLVDFAKREAARARAKALDEAAARLHICGHTFDQRETCVGCECRHKILALKKGGRA